MGECRHVCLFCCDRLPPGYQEETCLENQLPSGEILKIALNNGRRNKQAFEVLCKYLGVKWRKVRGEGMNFTQGSCLPLCYKCQNLYQDMFQLEQQIKMLEELIVTRAGIVKGMIKITELENKGGGRTQLTLMGLDVFRKKVVGSEHQQQQENELNEDFLMDEEENDLDLTMTSFEETAVVKQEGIQPQNYNPDSEEMIQDPLWDDSNDGAGSTVSSSADVEVDLNDTFEAANSPAQFDSEEEEEEVIRKPAPRSTRVSARLALTTTKTTKDPSVSSEDSDSEDSDDSFSKKVSSRSSKRKSTTSSTPRPSRNLNSKVFTCHLCDLAVTGYSNFNAHYRQDHPEEKRYTCKYCQRHYRDLRDVQAHQASKHTGERPFPCTLCSSAFVSSQCLASHVKFMHERHLACSFCPQQFSTELSLEAHLVYTHNQAPKTLTASSKRWRATCHICDLTIYHRQAFADHYKTVHPEERKFSCKFCKKHFGRLRECVVHQHRHKKERPFTCDLCQKPFQSSRSLAAHKAVLHSLPTESQKIFPCSLCHKQFPSLSSRKIHLETHNNSIIVCLVCGKGFKSITNWNRHNSRQHQDKATHSEPFSDPAEATKLAKSLGVSKTLKCHICWEVILERTFLEKHFREMHPEHKGGIHTCKCGKNYASYRDVTKHAFRHTNKKDFCCDQCPMTFYSEHELGLHRDTHFAPPEERRNWVCDVCGMGLVTQSGLRKHKVRFHNENGKGGLPRYECKECGKSWAEKKDWRKHNMTEHLGETPWKCGFCGKGFALEKDFERHVRTHTKPWSCPECGKQFSERHRLRNHAKHHPGRVKEIREWVEQEYLRRREAAEEEGNSGNGKEEGGGGNEGVLEGGMGYEENGTGVMAIAVKMDEEMV